MVGEVAARPRRTASRRRGSRRGTRGRRCGRGRAPRSGRFGTPARWASTWPIVMLALAVALVSGDVLADRVARCGAGRAREHVDDERGDRLRRRVDAERRVGRRRHLLGVARDRAGRCRGRDRSPGRGSPRRGGERRPAAPDGRRCGTSPCRPSRSRRRCPGDAGRFGIGLRGDGRDRFEVARDPDPAQRVGDDREARDRRQPVQRRQAGRQGRLDHRSRCPACLDRRVGRQCHLHRLDR